MSDSRGGASGAQRGGSDVPEQLVRLGAAIVIAGSMSMIAIAVIGEALSGIGMRRSEAVVAAILASAVGCPHFLLIAWHWGCSSRHATVALVALTIVCAALAIIFMPGRPW